MPDGRHDGNAWQQEHLVDNYGAAWHEPLPNGEIDAAIANVGFCRWENYHVEGLDWMCRNLGVDGVYLDGALYSREAMKRLRKVLDRNRPVGLFDLHEGQEFKYQDRRLNSLLKHLDKAPYIDSLWLGEGYDPNESPEYWLVEVSGIPFGLYGDMLDGYHAYRGMLFGMSGRHWGGARSEVTKMWKFWDQFGIQEAEMVGWWDAACPVKTDRPQVRATVYKKKGQSLIALASWEKGSTVNIRLRIDWQALGLDPARVKLYAPEIPGLQAKKTFHPGDEIPTATEKGWLLIATETGRQ